MHEAYLILIDKKVPSDEIGFIMYFSRTMKLLYLGERSRYNKAVKSREVELAEYFEVPCEGLDVDFIGLSEDDRIATDVLSHLPLKRVNQFLDVQEFKDCLPGHLKEIFELHYEKQLSAREISKLMADWTGYDMYYGRYNTMINEVKQKVKERWSNS